MAENRIPRYGLVASACSGQPMSSGLPFISPGGGTAERLLQRWRPHVHSEKCGPGPQTQEKSAQLHLRMCMALSNCRRPLTLDAILNLFSDNDAAEAFETGLTTPSTQRQQTWAALCLLQSGL
ncbi:hypothetical protein H920_13148 [Fukomys damarensis]|uniref:Uncharacterized protein n=1 Tax=Fukomys damarensis TaxID=885580 RepID=A0A091D2Z9_FUKDA|nr:hypothetical protein H920_13148 [Fukomys damarensis]